MVGSYEAAAARASHVSETHDVGDGAQQVELPATQRRCLRHGRLDARVDPVAYGESERPAAAAQVEDHIAPERGGLLDEQRAALAGDEDAGGEPVAAAVEVDRAHQVLQGFAGNATPYQLLEGGA